MRIRIYLTGRNKWIIGKDIDSILDVEDEIACESHCTEIHFSVVRPINLAIDRAVACGVDAIGPEGLYDYRDAEFVVAGNKIFIDGWQVAEFNEKFADKVEEIVNKLNRVLKKNSCVVIV